MNWYFEFSAANAQGSVSSFLGDIPQKFCLWVIWHDGSKKARMPNFLRQQIQATSEHVER